MCLLAHSAFRTISENHVVCLGIITCSRKTDNRQISHVCNQTMSMLFLHWHHHQNRELRRQWRGSSLNAVSEFYLQWENRDWWVKSFPIVKVFFFIFLTIFSNVVSTNYHVCNEKKRVQMWPWGLTRHISIRIGHLVRKVSFEWKNINFDPEHIVYSWYQILNFFSPNVSILWLGRE